MYFLLSFYYFYYFSFLSFSHIAETSRQFEPICIRFMKTAKAVLNLCENKPRPLIPIYPYRKCIQHTTMYPKCISFTCSMPWFIRYCDNEAIKRTTKRDCRYLTSKKNLFLPSTRLLYNFLLTFFFSFLLFFFLWVCFFFVTDVLSLFSTFLYLYQTFTHSNLIRS